MKDILLVKKSISIIMEPLSESSSDESDYSLDGYEYHAPPLILP